ncbi:MAG: hypothetical protein KF883_09250 [Thermomicrobiales bacterium]|nr:hypothetical protein [Thermomicrobiales bacterium]
MMQTYRLVIDTDGQIRIPNAKPGQVAIVQIADALDDRSTVPLTLATAKTPEERQLVMENIQSLASRLRERLKDQLPLSADELYDEHGLPG